MADSIANLRLAKGAEIRAIFPLTTANPSRSEAREGPRTPQLDQRRSDMNLCQITNHTHQ